MPSSGKTYTNGVMESLSKTVARIERKLDDNLKWQQEADRSLAAGNERFNNLDQRCDRLEAGQEKLKDRDRNVSFLTVVLSAVATFLGITVNK